MRTIEACNKFQRLDRTPDSGTSTHIHRPATPGGGHDNYICRKVAVFTMPDLPDGTALLAALRDPLRASAAARFVQTDDSLRRELASVGRVARHVMNAPVAAICAVESDRVVLLAAQGSEHLVAGQELPIGDSFCAYTVVPGKPLLIANALSDFKWRNFTAVRALDLIAYAGVPILSIEGQPVGTVSVFDRVPRAWDDAAARCLEDLAAVIGALVEANTRDRTPAIRN